MVWSIHRKQKAREAIEKSQIELGKDIGIYGKASKILIELILRKRQIEIELSKHPNTELERELNQIIRRINALDEKVQSILRDIEKCNKVEQRHVNDLFNLETRTSLSQWPTPSRLHYRER